MKLWCTMIVATLMMAACAKPGTVRVTGGKPLTESNTECYWNSTGQACSDLTDDDYWAGCKDEHSGSGVKDWAWAEAHCTTFM